MSDSRNAEPPWFEIEMALIPSTKASNVDSATPSPSPSEAIEERYACNEFLLIVQCEFRLRVNAVTKTGDLIPNLCITSPYGSLPSYMGFTVHASDLHMIGGYPTEHDDTGLLYSLDTFVLGVRNIPSVLASADGLSRHLSRGPRLNSLKIIPAVYIVKDCIYVLSNGIHGRNSPFSDFEFRKLEALAWTPLPNPPVSAAHVRDHPFGFVAGVESHALVGHESIVISLTDRMGAFVFDIASGNWTTVDQIGFIGQAISAHGFCYAASSSAIQVFQNDVWFRPVEELRIREIPSKVSLYTTHQIAVVGDVTFIVRCGSPAVHDEFVGTRPVYLALDRYEVSRAWDDEECCCRHSITELEQRDALYLTEEVFEGYVTQPYCLPAPSLAIVSEREIGSGAHTDCSPSPSPLQHVRPKRQETVKHIGKGVTRPMENVLEVTRVLYANARVVQIELQTKLNNRRRRALVYKETSNITSLQLKLWKERLARLKERLEMLKRSMGKSFF